MNIPQTETIFKILSKGRFISYNSADEDIKALYAILEDSHNFDQLYDYFLQIGFVLENENGYFYFSRQENRTHLERKLARAYEWIDILDFFKTYDHAFGPGFRFTPEDILARRKTDADLETKLKGLGKHVQKQAYPAILAGVLKKLTDDDYIELENSITHQYKVLAAFTYLEDLIAMINIPEDIQDEIPE